MKPPSPPSLPAPLRLHIGTLALPAGSIARGERIAAALQTELARLLGAESSLQRLRESTHHAAVLDAGALRLGRHERPEQIGRRLAQSLAQSLLDPIERARHGGARR